MRKAPESVRFTNPLLATLEEEIGLDEGDASEQVLQGYGLQRAAGLGNSVERILGEDYEPDGAPLTPEDEQLLRDAFAVVDFNADGEISHDELDAVLHVLGARPTEEEVATIMARLDCGTDGAFEMDDWFASARAGHLKVKDRGATLDVDKLLEIREAYLQMDENGDGTLQLKEFISAMRLILNGKHLDGRSAKRIWKRWAEPTGDISCEMICWVKSFSEWSTEALEQDPLRKKFISEFSQGVALDLGVPAARVRVDSVLLGAASRVDQLEITAEKVSDEWTADGKRLKHSEAQTVEDYSADICTVAVVVESLDVNRLIRAVSRGDVAAVEAELAKGVNVNAEAPQTGATPLHVAAQNGHADLCTFLLESGADSTKKNGRGKTPLDTAEALLVDGDSGSKLEAVIDILRNADSHYSASAGSAAHESVILDGDDVSKLLKQFRTEVRKKLDNSGDGMTYARVGNNSIDHFYIRKLLHVEEEKAITWPGFVKGYSQLRHTPLGEQVTLSLISELSSACLHRLVEEEVHLRELYHPSISRIERMGIRMLSRSTASDAAVFKWQDDMDAPQESGDEVDDELLFHGSRDFDKRSPAEEKLLAFAKQERVYDTSTRKLIDKGVLFCAFTGGTAAILAGLGDVLAIELYQPDAIVAGEKCLDQDSEGSVGSGSASSEECVEHRFILEAFLLISLPFMILCGLIEVGGMYYITMRNCMKISHMVGLVLWPLDVGRVRIARGMVQAAFGINPSNHKLYGLDPLRDAPGIHIAMRALFHRVKIGASKKMMKMLMNRVLARLGASEASTHAAVSAFSVVPVGVLWNAVVAYNNTLEARLRAVGTLVAIHYVDRLLPLNGIHDKAGTLNDAVCKAVMRAIACVVVAKRHFHANSDALYRRVHERLLHLDYDLTQNDSLFEDNEGYG
eukprot:COSAG02_NODE_261_length_26663_cov_210.330899_7_plen_914_part_00